MQELKREQVNKHLVIGTIVIRDSDGRKVRKPITRVGQWHEDTKYSRNVKHKGKQTYDN